MLPGASGPPAAMALDGSSRGAPSRVPEDDGWIEDEAVGLAEMVESYERNLVVQALTRMRGAVSAAARALGISRGALQYKIKKYGIQTVFL